LGTTVAMTLLAGTAHADSVRNDVALVIHNAGQPDEFVRRETTVAEDQTVTVSYHLQAQQGGTDSVPGCNATPDAPVAITVVAPPEVTASTTSFSFTDCTTEVPVDYSSTTPSSTGYRIDVTASGQGENRVTQATFRLFVTDATAPTFDETHTRYALATSAAGANVNYPTPTATDEVDGPVPVTCSPPSGSLFAPGSTTVTCTATDAAGNSATTQFEVKVFFGATWLSCAGCDEDDKELKGGSTNPVKFTVYKPGGGYITDLSIISSASITKLSNGSSTPLTGFKVTGHDIHNNVKVPTSPGKYRITVNFTDGTHRSCVIKVK
jgi:hypothetical protein